jgi:signal transduction histidine kinase
MRQPKEEEPIASGEILVVDDNPANLLAIEAALTGIDCRVVRAQSGDEALRLLLVRDFALILLDVKMPTLDGFETARIIRSRKRSRHTPIIFVTAHSRDDAEVLAAYQLGAVDFLFKPIIREVLQTKAGVFVELQRRTAEVARQAELIREHERREHERALAEERSRWEAEALRQRMEQLADADRRKDEFLAVLGHELRNPLVPIVTGLELLREKLAGDACADKSTQRVREAMERQAQHLTRLVDDLLDISRISSGRIELRKAPIEIQSVLEQAIATSRPLIDQKRHHLSCRQPEQAVWVEGDAVRLVQVVANLINNAAHYTRDEGTIAVSANASDGQVEIRVSDTGRGISAEFLPHVFEMFAQGRATGDGGGLGLGLAIVRRLVIMHGGSVSAHSAGQGLGSEFAICLPLATPAVAAAATANGGASADALSTGAQPAPSQQATASASAAVTAPKRGLVIALVEDNDDGREVMTELLTRWGHKVEVAKDGIEGAALIARLRPDLALVDVGLPGLDGYGVVASVRKQIGCGVVRLVAMTGFGQDSDRRRAREAGFDAHLVKPVSIEALQKVVSFKEQQ